MTPTAISSTRNLVFQVRANLAGWLDSPRINARTDDEKTLLPATRRP